MSAAFDPYYQWLSIPPAEQPPHLYRLLAVKALEDNLDVIATAADRQMLHLRTYQSGKHAELSQKLLNEVAAARVTLLDPAKKAAYDKQLRAKLQQHKQKRKQQPLPVAAPLEADPTPAPRAPDSLQPIIHTHRRAAQAGLPKPAFYGAIACGAALLLVGGAIALALRPWESPAPVAVGETVGGEVQTVQTITTTDNKPHSEEQTSSTDPPPPPSTNDQPDNGGAAAEPPDDAEPVDSTDNPVDDSDDEETQLAAADDSSPPAGPKKLPVPDKAARDAKRAQILAIFPIDKARTVEEKSQLAGQLLKTARETKDDLPAQFALLNLAREQAVEAGKIKSAFEAIDLLADKFEFDADTVRVLSLQESAKAPVPPADKRDIVTLGMGMIDGFVAADEFDKAAALSERLVNIARPIRDAELLKTIAEQRRAADALAADYRKARAAFETLKTNPDDPAANLAAGRYLAFVKQDWETGLVHLSKSSDERLSAAAKLELAAPETAAEQEKLADTWWSAAEAEKEKPFQDLARARSGYWYRQAAPQLSGLAKAKAEKRISEAGEWTGPRTAPRSTSPVPAVREPVEGLVAHWKFDEGQGDIARDSVGGNHASIRGATWTKGNRGVAISFANDGYAELPTSVLNRLPQYTIAGCIQIDDASGKFRIFSNFGGSGPILEIQAVARGNVNAAAWNKDRQGNDWLRGSTANLAIRDGEWHFFAARFAATGGKDGTMKIWIDEQAFEFPFQMVNSDRARSTRIGGRGEGSVCELRLYARALRDEEVAALYTATSGKPAPQTGAGGNSGAASGGTSSGAKPDLGIFSRDPSEFQRPPPSDFGVTPATPADE